MNDKSFNWFFLLLPLGVIINMLFAWDYKEFLTPDSHTYIKMAKELPIISNSLFPLFYPILLKTFNMLFSDYLLTYKVINIFTFLLVIVFVRYKNFYWKEIWTITTFASFQTIYITAWSENLFILLIVLLLYVNNIYLEHKLTVNKFILSSILILLLMFTTKYNAVFYVIGYVGFSFYLYLSKEKKASIAYFSTSLFAGFLMLGYLIFNQYYTGNFTGVRGNNFEEMSFLRYASLSLANVPLILTPSSYAFTKILYQPEFLYSYPILWRLPMVGAVITIIYSLYKITRVESHKITKFMILSIGLAFSFLVLTFVSAYFTRIDVLGPRLLVGFYAVILIAIIQYITINNIKISDKFLLGIGLYSIVTFAFSIYYNGFV